MPSLLPLQYETRLYSRVAVSLYMTRPSSGKCIVFDDRGGPGIVDVGRRDRIGSLHAWLRVDRSGLAKKTFGGEIRRADFVVLR